MSRRGKAVAYGVLAAALLVLSWWIQSGLHPLTVAGVLRGINGLFYVGIALTGFGVYRRRGSDARFCTFFGIGVIVSWMVMFFLFGGMDNAAVNGADIAANILMLLWTALPLCALVRGTLLVAAARRDDYPKKRRPALVLLAVLWAGAVVLLLCGQLLGFVHL